MIFFEVLTKWKPCVITVSYATISPNACRIKFYWEPFFFFSSGRFSLFGKLVSNSWISANQVLVPLIKRKIRYTLCNKYFWFIFQQGLNKRQIGFCSRSGEKNSSFVNWTKPGFENPPLKVRKFKAVRFVECNWPPLILSDPRALLTVVIFLLTIFRNGRQT